MSYYNYKMMDFSERNALTGYCGIDNIKLKKPKKSIIAVNKIIVLYTLYCSVS